MKIKPTYKKNSIVNLMSSLVKTFDLEPSYPSLSHIDHNNLKSSKNIILLILDGIGYKYLKEKGKDNVIYENLLSKLKTVFPSSTASAIPTFYTGYPPQQHTVTGWYTWLKEFGMVTTILPFKGRFADISFEKFDINISSVLPSRSLLESRETDRQFYNVTLQKLKDSEFNSHFTPAYKKIGYRTLEDCFQKIVKIIGINDEKKYIKAYWNAFDRVSHDDGTNSTSASNEFLKICIKLGEFIEQIKDTDTSILITSDHGFVNSSERKAFQLENHPEFKKCLTVPFCGDNRTIFCYVRPSKTDNFVNYWEDHFSDVSDLKESKDLVKKGYFGIHDPEPKFLERIGDYVLIMDENYIFNDALEYEDEHVMIGNHGGLSEDEMLVPLSIIDLE